MCGHEGLIGQVYHPVTYIFVKRREEDALFSVKGMGYGEPDTAEILVQGQVRRFNTVS